MLGLVSSTIDFEILDIDNLKNLVFLDTSKYSEDPSNPILEMILPGSQRYLITQIQPRVINILDSNLFGLSDGLKTNQPLDLGDGIYRFTYKFCPYDYYHITKFHFRTVCIDRKIQDIYCKMDVDDCLRLDLPKVKMELMDIYILLESAKANASLGKVERASKDYSMADKKVSKLLDKIK